MIHFQTKGSVYIGLRKAIDLVRVSYRSITKTMIRVKEIIWDVTLKRTLRHLSSFLEVL